MRTMSSELRNSKPVLVEVFKVAPFLFASLSVYQERRSLLKEKVEADAAKVKIPQEITRINQMLEFCDEETHFNKFLKRYPQCRLVLAQFSEKFKAIFADEDQMDIFVDTLMGKIKGGKRVDGLMHGDSKPLADFSDKHEAVSEFLLKNLAQLSRANELYLNFAYSSYKISRGDLWLRDDLVEFAKTARQKLNIMKVQIAKEIQDSFGYKVRKLIKPNPWVVLMNQCIGNISVHVTHILRDGPALNSPDHRCLEQGTALRKAISHASRDLNEFFNSQKNKPDNVMQVFLSMNNSIALLYKQASELDVKAKTKAEVLEKIYCLPEQKLSNRPSLKYK